MRKTPVHALAPLALLASSLTAACGGSAASAVAGPVATAPTPTPSPAASPTPTPSPAATAAPLFFGLEAQGIGDPNPYFENGRYYVFYLQNEGRHPWRMSSSSDLTSWSPPADAVPVGQAGEPDYWTGSGSIVANPAGSYRIFYTGHLPGGTPQETVMVSRADALADPWSKLAAPRFSGPPDYEQWDFRDPFVFWNDEARAWWLLITTRKNGQAAIGRYTSSDLDHWTAAPPLYTETSPLNLEVPDFFREGSDWFLLFSDQRDAARQTRYLKAASSSGPFAYGPFDALDGRGFYAGKTAGTGADRLLFGWVASRRDRRDDTELVWGGDLVAHAIRRTDSGALAVDIAAPLAQQFVTTTRRLSPGAPVADPVVQGSRIMVDLSVRPGDKFGFRFTRNGAADAVAEIDSASQQASFVIGGRSGDAPRVAIPSSADGRYHLELLLDPRQGFGILYINHFRALSFRYYGLSGTVPTAYAEGGLITLDGEVRTK
ncbi:hypothetical protein [Sphingomonas sp. OTU376]|uniref:hypothetical protein n=1 Tax=Sphingomonas sp. OTU376 TaxID=3043863 RepID=UPI00313EAE4A